MVGDDRAQAHAGKGGSAVGVQGLDADEEPKDDGAEEQVDCQFGVQVGPELPDGPARAALGEELFAQQGSSPLLPGPSRQELGDNPAAGSRRTRPGG